MKSLRIRVNNVIYFCVICLFCSILACKKNEPAPGIPNKAVNDTHAASRSAFTVNGLELPEGFKIVETSSPYKMVLTPYAASPIFLEKYEPQVIFEAKWGTGPGEFGVAYSMVDGSLENYEPTGRAVNSKGEIYIFDIVNNRIQKFSSTGKFIKIIPVLSFADKDGVPLKKESKEIKLAELYYEGKNIVFDLKDNLYYACRIGEKGEIWKFDDNDLLVKKYETIGISELMLNSMQEPWLYMNYGRYDLFNNIISSDAFYIPSGYYDLPSGRKIQIIEKDMNSTSILIFDKDGKSREYLIRFKGKMWLSDAIWETSDGCIFIWIGSKSVKYIPNRMVLVFDKNGLLKSLIETHVYSTNIMDKKGNIYAYHPKDDGHSFYRLKLEHIKK